MIDLILAPLTPSVVLLIVAVMLHVRHLFELMCGTVQLRGLDSRSGLLSAELEKCEAFVCRGKD